MVYMSKAALALQPSIIRDMSRRRRSDTVDLTLGQPGLAPDQDLLQRAFDASLSGTQGYTENAGLLELRDAVARHHGRVGPEEVIITVGSEQAVYLALSCVIAPGDEVLVPDPGYPAYPAIVSLLGGVPKYYPVLSEAGLVPEVDSLLEMAGPRTRAVLWNTPSNPFGTMADAELNEELVEVCAENGWVVLSDEIYRDLRYEDGPFSSPVDTSDQTIVVSGLSKSCALTGYRLGYLCAPTPFIKQATLAHQLMVTCAPRLSQLVALEVFREPKRLTSHLDHYLAARAELVAAAEELPKEAPLHVGPGAFYAALDVSAYSLGGAQPLALELLEAENVAVVPGIAFGPSGDWFWRLSYAAGADVAGEGVRRIARFLRSRSQVPA